MTPTTQLEPELPLWTLKPNYMLADVFEGDKKITTLYAGDAEKIVAAHNAALSAIAADRNKREGEASTGGQSEKEKLFDYLTTLATDAGFPNISTAIAQARWPSAAPVSAVLGDDLILEAVDAAYGNGRVALTHVNNEGVTVPTDVAKCFARALSARLLPEGWVSVKDRLPEAKGDVLVYCADTNEQFVAFHCGGGEFQYAQDRHGERIVCRPTHWKPLPTNPKEA